MQIHCKGEEIKDLSVFIYMSLVLKPFINCRNYCLMVRFFQISALHLCSGPCVCVCVEGTLHYWAMSLSPSFVLVPFSFERKRGGGSSAGYWIAEGL